MYFSNEHTFRNDDSIRQILVFTNKELLAEYKEKLNNDYHVSNKLSGASYILRSVKEDENEFRSVIRCAHTGDVIKEYPVMFSNSIDAMLNSVRMLNAELQEKLTLLTLCIVQQNNTESKLY